MNRATAMDEHRRGSAIAPAPARRAGAFLADVGMGFVGLALGAMLHRDGVARADAGPRLGPARRQAPFPAPGQAGHLVDDARRASATSRASTPSPN